MSLTQIDDVVVPVASSWGPLTNVPSDNGYYANWHALSDGRLIAFGPRLGTYPDYTFMPYIRIYDADFNLLDSRSLAGRFPAGVQNIAYVVPVAGNKVLLTNMRTTGINTLPGRVNEIWMYDVDKDVARNLGAFPGFDDAGYIQFNGSNPVTSPLDAGYSICVGNYLPDYTVDPRIFVINHTTGALTQAATPSTAILPAGVMFFASAQLPDGRFVCYGAYTLDFGVQYKTVAIYNPATDTWTAVPDTAAFHGGQIALVGNRLYLCGEFSSNSNVMEVLDLANIAGGWTIKAPRGPPGQCYGVLALGDGRIVHVGASDAAQDDITTHIYDIASDTWVRVANYPAAGRVFAELGLDSQGRFRMVGNSGTQYAAFAVPGVVPVRARTGIGSDPFAAEELSATFKADPGGPIYKLDLAGTKMISIPNLTGDTAARVVQRAFSSVEKP
jgi:hypothetical protein